MTEDAPKRKPGRPKGKSVPLRVNFTLPRHEYDFLRHLIACEKAIRRNAQHRCTNHSDARIGSNVQVGFS